MPAWPSSSAAHVAMWILAALATAGVILRPLKIPEAVWALTGAAAPVLTAAGKAAAMGIAATAVVLMMASARGVSLGLPTCIAGLVTASMACWLARSAPWRYVRRVSWGVIPLVAGLFMLVEALDESGVIRAMSDLLRTEARHAAVAAAAASGIAVGVVSNVINNLPAGLIAGTVVQSAELPPSVTGALLVGVDVGPNLSVTGSLATLLWLTALRREGIHVKASDFFRLGLWVMPPALLAALGGLLLF